MSWSIYVLFAVIGILVQLPPCADPAIKWKEFNERWRERLERRANNRKHRDP